MIRLQSQKALLKSLRLVNSHLKQFSILSPTTFKVQNPYTLEVPCHFISK